MMANSITTKAYMDRLNHKRIQDVTDIQNKRHLEALSSIANAYDEDEALVICKVFAERFPEAMYAALHANNNVVIV